MVYGVFFYKKKLNSPSTFSSYELDLLLSNNFFTPIKTEYCLFLPPLKNKFLTNKIRSFEVLNNRLTKYFAGLIITKGKKNYLSTVSSNNKIVKQKIRGDIRA